MSIVSSALNRPVLKTAISIVKALEAHGHAAYLVGGCVRDLVMGVDPREADIATSATPDVVQEIFPDTIAVGQQFGVILVRTDGLSFEVATFRSDSAYSDGRHPDAVTYARTAEEDSRRRDFTINALFYDPVKDALLDFHGGREDIRQKRIRAIGIPRERFQEDRLRLLRAVRFAVRFGFEIETETRQAIVESAAAVQHVSAERVRDELTKILTEGHSYPGFQMLEELALLDFWLPELKEMQGVEQPPEFHPEGDVWVHTMLLLKFMDTRGEEVRGRRSAGSLADVRYEGRAGSEGSGQTAGGTEKGRCEEAEKKKLKDLEIEAGPPSSRVPVSPPRLPGFSPAHTSHLAPHTYPSTLLAWGALLHDVGKPATFERAPDRIRFNGHVELGATIARKIGRRFRMSNDFIDALAELVLDHLKFKDVFHMKASTLKRFVRRPAFPEHLELHRLDCLASHGNLEAYDFVRDYALSLKPEEARPQPLLTGHDLIRLGYTAGPQFKSILTVLEDEQLESRVTDREAAIRYVKDKFPLT